MARTKRSLRRIDLRVYTRYERGKMVYSFQPIGDAFVALGAKRAQLTMSSSVSRGIGRSSYCRTLRRVLRQVIASISSLLRGLGLSRIDSPRGVP